jgi:UPF0755 protein
MKRRRREADPVRLASRLTLAGAAALLVVAAAWALLTPVGQGQPQMVTVAPGQSVSETAFELGQRGLIRSPRLFVAAAYLTGKWRRLQAGRYDLTPSMSAVEMLDALCRGARKAWRWATIPEGYTLRQIAEELQRQELVSAREFLLQAHHAQSFALGFPTPGGSLEGFLFPDTYRVDVGESASEILAQMLRRFDQVVWQGMFHEKASYGGRSLREIVILASLVEAEAKKEKERPLIAGVLMNRLRRGIKLECDATVQYALGGARKSRLTRHDLLIDSEYNTYRHAGLPPGPICSPGEASLGAAMEPAKVPYLYYVARPDGSHVFSESFAQHQAAIAWVRKAEQGR